jgi:hypothetical protein
MGRSALIGIFLCTHTWCQTLPNLQWFPLPSLKGNTQIIGFYTNPEPGWELWTQPSIGYHSVWRLPLQPEATALKIFHATPKQGNYGMERFQWVPTAMGNVLKFGVFQMYRPAQQTLSIFIQPYEDGEKPQLAFSLPAQPTDRKGWVSAIPHPHGTGIFHLNAQKNVLRFALLDSTYSILQTDVWKMELPMEVEGPWFGFFKDENTLLTYGLQAENQRYTGRRNRSAFQFIEYRFWLDRRTPHYQRDTIYMPSLAFKHVQVVPNLGILHGFEKEKPEKPTWMLRLTNGRFPNGFWWNTPFLAPTPTLVKSLQIPIEALEESYFHVSGSSFFPEDSSWLVVGSFQYQGDLCYMDSRSTRIHCTPYHWAYHIQAAKFSKEGDVIWSIDIPRQQLLTPYVWGSAGGEWVWTHGNHTYVFWNESPENIGKNKPQWVHTDPDRSRVRFVVLNTKGIIRQGNIPADKKQPALLPAYCFATDTTAWLAGARRHRVFAGKLWWGQPEN